MELFTLASVAKPNSVKVYWAILIFFTWSSKQLNYNNPHSLGKFGSKWLEIKYWMTIVFRQDFPSVKSFFFGRGTILGFIYTKFAK